MTVVKRVSWMAGIVGVGVVLVLIAGASGAQGQTPPQVKQVPFDSILSVEGKDNFMAYCAVCHGADGRGHGPAAPALKGPIPDLTTIAKRQGNKFNATAILRVISGADRVPPAHGSIEMPIWGPLLRGPNPDTATATMRLRNLVTYVESLQAR
jgi:mono/diheme cytochrome c family protein